MLFLTKKTFPCCTKRTWLRFRTLNRNTVYVMCIQSFDFIGIYQNLYLSIWSYLIYLYIQYDLSIFVIFLLFHSNIQNRPKNHLKKHTFPTGFHPGSTTFTCRRLQDSSSAARSKAPEKPSKWSKDKRRHWPPVGMENGGWGWTTTTTTTTTTATTTMYVSSKTRIEGVNEIIIWLSSSWRREEIATEASHENNQWWKSRWDTTTTITHCEFKNMIQHPPQ